MENLPEWIKKDINANESIFKCINMWPISKPNEHNDIYQGGIGSGNLVAFSHNDGEYILDIYYSHNGYVPNPPIYKSNSFLDVLKNYFNRCVQMMEAVNKYTLPPLYDIEKETKKYQDAMNRAVELSKF